MFRAPRCLAAVLLVAFAACAASPPAAAEKQATNNTKTYTAGGNRVTAWSEGFGGWQTRTWGDDGSWLWVNFDMTKGAYDAGIGRNLASGARVDGQAVGKGVKAKVSVSGVGGSGYYWLGPKTIISSTPSYSGLTGQYECYIVEKSNKSPAWLVDKVGLKLRGRGTYDGSVYKHYTKTYRGILQIWSIRQRYRNGGYTSVGYIQRDWRRLNLTKNWFNLGWKYNVEVNGQLKGEIGFSDLSLPGN